MEIISFTGKSGMGKSYQATKLSRKLGADAIIDDGLLIYHDRIVAGSSAKKCVSKAAAMRTALFNYAESREAVQKALRKYKPAKLMILGTSDRMVDWITDTLELPRADRRIYIEDVTTEEERKIAGKSRYKMGEHVIPVPMVQLKRSFAGYFMNPVRLFKNITMDDPEQQGERTVVRPAYSYFGKFEISENALEDIIMIAAGKYMSILKVRNFFNNGNSAALDIILVLNVRTANGLMDKCAALQREVKESIEQMTAFSVNHVNVQIKDIMYRHGTERGK